MLDFEPFRAGSISSFDASKMREQADSRLLLIGCFEQINLNQLLYLLTENILDGAVIARVDEKNFRHVAEISKKPLFIKADGFSPAAVEAAERLPVKGLFFKEPPAEEVSEIIKKQGIYPFVCRGKMDLPMPFAYWKTEDMP